MEDRYMYNQEGIKDKITAIYKYLEDYKNKILEIKSLINEISSSPSWYDTTVKTSFIETCNSYITKYNSGVSIMESYLKHLEAKADDGVAVENKGAKMMPNE